MSANIENICDEIANQIDDNISIEDKMKIKLSVDNIIDDYIKSVIDENDNVELIKKEVYDTFEELYLCDPYTYAKNTIEDIEDENAGYVYSIPEDVDFFDDDLADIVPIDDEY